MAERVLTPALPVGAPKQDRPGPAVPSTRRWWRRTGAGRAHPALFLFTMPALVLYVFFFAIPTLQAFQFAATDWDGFSPDYESVGLANFERLATGDDLFRNALTNNLKFMLVVVLFQTLISLGLAVFLVKNSRSSTVLRALFFFPTILSSVSVAFIWKFVYDPNFGLINSALRAVGLDGLQSAFLGDPQKAIFFVAIAQVWFHTGQMMVIYIAGLQQIPTDLYEAADLDGASRGQQFRFITWPLIAPAMAIVIAYTTVQTFRAFDLILGISGNPPARSLDILSTRVYASFANSQYGYAAAESVVFMVVIALVTFLQRRAVRYTQASA